MDPPASQGPRAVVRPGWVLDLGDHSAEVLATPAETRDRYRLRIVARPGGGPGIEGDGPHVHPALLERFHCLEGHMTARLGRDLHSFGPGDRLEVPPGAVHGFVNSGDAPLVVEAEVVFPPPGPRASADLMAFAARYDALRREGRIDPRTGEPPLLQMAVLMRAYREAIAAPGVAGLLMGPLAALGRLRGYRVDPPRDEG